MDIIVSMHQAVRRLDAALSWFHYATATEEIDKAILNLNGAFKEVDALRTQAVAQGLKASILDLPVMRKTG